MDGFDLQPPKFRDYRVIPDTVDSARTPVDRFILLAGSVERAAEALNVSVPSIYRYRARKGQGRRGFFPEHLIEKAEAALAADGYLRLPKGFLTLPGQFPAPEREARDA